MAAGAVARVAKTAWDTLWNPTVERGVLQSGEAGLQRLGPLGETLSVMLRQSQDNTEARVGALAEHYIPRARALGEDPLKTQELVMDLKRVRRATTPEVQELADFSRLANEQIYQEAQQTGIKVGPRVQDDWHLMYPREVFEGSNRDAAIQRLVDTGQATSYRSAEKMLNSLESKGGRVHSLESPRRVNLPGAREDTAVVYDHLSNSYRRVEQAKIFGPKDENLDYILDGIRAEYGVPGYKYARLVADSFLGRTAGYSPVGDIDHIVGHGDYQKIASIEAVMHLGLAFISQSIQPLNAVVFGARGGLTPTVKALRDTVLDYGNATEFALRAGSTLMHTAHEFRQAAGVEQGTIGGAVLNYTPFMFLDKLSRIFSSQVGRHMAEESIQKLVQEPGHLGERMTLKLLGIDADKALAQGLTESDVLEAAKRVSDITSFRATPLDIPPQWKNNPTLKLLTMYKSATFSQAKFLKDYVFKPAVYEGEMRPLLYLATLFPTFGEMVADTKEFIRKGTLEERPKEVVDRMIDNVAQVGGFGIMHDMIYAFASPNKEMAYRFVVGPAIGDAVETASLPFSKHPIADIEKKIVSSIPVVGPIAKRKLFPVPLSERPKNALQEGAVTKTIKKAGRRIAQAFE
jgi:hypothetical protein